MSRNVLVTGGNGCLGAWICKLLVADGDLPIAADIDQSNLRMRAIMGPEELGQVRFVNMDVTDQAAVRRVAKTHGPVSRIIHTAALQVPSVRQDPVLGAEVNVIGTVNVFETAKSLGIDRVVFASSVAVYGPADRYAFRVLPHDAELAPTEHYGVYKQANEAAAQVYWRHDGVSSIGLRPHTLYGPGRDRGITSEPTQAMRAAARGESFTVGYGGQSGFMFVEDVARTFIEASTVDFEGADVFGMRGQVADMEEVVAIINKVAKTKPGQIDFDPTPLAFPAGLDDTALRELLGELPERSLEMGIGLTIEYFEERFTRDEERFTRDEHGVGVS